MRLLKEVFIISLDEIVQSLKNTKAILMIIAYIALMMAGLKLGSFLEILSIFFTEGRRTFSLSLPYYISVILLPLFSVFISYDIISEEVNSRSIRYLASRVNRAAIILGKYLGAIALSFSMIFVAYVVSSIYLYFKLNEVILYNSVVSWLYLGLYSASIIAITVLISTLTKKPHSSLNLSIVVLVITLIILNPVWPVWLTALSPLYYSTGALKFLTSDGSMTVGLSALFGYIILCLSSAILYFRRCDL